MKEKLKELMKFSKFVHLDVSKLDLDALDEHEFDQLIAKAIEDEKKIENFLENVKNREFKDDSPVIASFMVERFTVKWGEKDKNGENKVLLDSRIFNDYETGGLSYKFNFSDVTDRSYKIIKSQQLSNGDIIHRFHLKLTGCTQMFCLAEYLARNIDVHRNIFNSNSEVILGFQKKIKDQEIYSISLMLDKNNRLVFYERNANAKHDYREEVYVLQY